jgi:60 kDa SS-A/Ro ribonucleoprotein
MAKYAKLAATPIPQSEPLDERQVLNNAEGWVYQIDDWARLDRFLVLGSSEATYYQKAPALTRENAKCVTRCYDESPVRTVQAIFDVSDKARAPKNDAAIFALAIGASHKDLNVRKTALAVLPGVCRTSTHLFQFLDCVRSLGRGWGRGLKRAVAKWYNMRDVGDVAYQAIKYRAREGYTHKRALELAHAPVGADYARRALYRWMKNKEVPLIDLPPLVRAHMRAMSDEITAENRLDLIKEYRLPWEAIPTSETKNPAIWQAMLPNMGLTALIRNLGAMTSYDVFKPLSDEVSLVCKRLTDESELQKARVHPFGLLQALVIYKDGHGFRGKLSWSPVGNIADALEEAYYKSFKFVVPTNKRTLIALDVSGSMGSRFNDSALTVREAAGCMAMVTARTEPKHHIVGFTSALPGGWTYRAKSHHSWSGFCRHGDGIAPLDITARMQLDRVVKTIEVTQFGATDCALPMLYAQAKGLDVDVFVIYTDNETWSGNVHPMQALRDYRKSSGILAKLATVGMTSTGFSISDPDDGGCMDVVGFDAAAPSVIADFARK